MVILFAAVIIRRGMAGKKLTKLSLGSILAQVRCNRVFNRHPPSVSLNDARGTFETKGRWGCPVEGGIHFFHNGETWKKQFWFVFLIILAFHFFFLLSFLLVFFFQSGCKDGKSEIN